MVFDVMQECLCALARLCGSVGLCGGHEVALSLATSGSLHASVRPLSVSVGTDCQQALTCHRSCRASAHEPRKTCRGLTDL